MNNKQKKIFTSHLMQWHKEINNRTMPWKGIKDTYKIWLSEIILQQTRVEQGTVYYEKFITAYPTIHDLANAKDEQVFKLWEGLGYYNRCKNLLITAREIVKKYNGIFPENYEELLKFKGIGPYTAAAIASFAFNKPYAVVDGNVFRVLARFFGNNLAIDTTEGKYFFTNLANDVLDKNNAALYNQAIMDFGATVCKPVIALCSSCILNTYCLAHKNGQVNHLPVKEKKLIKKKRFFCYFIFNYQNKILIHKRVDKDIWQNLFEFFLYETETIIQWDIETIQSVMQEIGIKLYEVKQISKEYQQQLTHQNIKTQFIEIKLKKMPTTLKKYQWVDTENLKQFAFPKLINNFLKEQKLI